MEIQEIRLAALREAQNCAMSLHDQDRSPAAIVARAKAYEDYISGMVTLPPSGEPEAFTETGDYPQTLMDEAAAQG